MGELSEFPLKWRLFLKTYAWRTNDPVPWAPLARPLAESRVAIVSSAGFVLEGQQPFDDAMKGGDPSFREIESNAEVAQLVESHRSALFDHEGIRRDPNLAFPLDRVRELAADGVVGSLNRRHFSVMGSITAPGRMMTDSAPEIARRLREDGVDAALLVPV
ncbi:MAG: glycine/sarcosine/betaine reductase selenoprotein B family protein [Thermoanaerobaculia bacterium]